MLWASGPRGSTLAYPLSCRSGWFQTCLPVSNLAPSCFPSTNALWMLWAALASHLSTNVSQYAVDALSCMVLHLPPTCLQLGPPVSARVLWVLGRTIRHLCPAMSRLSPTCLRLSPSMQWVLCTFPVLSPRILWMFCAAWTYTCLLLSPNKLWVLWAAGSYTSVRCSVGALGYFFFVCLLLVSQYAMLRDFRSSLLSGSLVHHWGGRSVPSTCFHAFHICFPSLFLWFCSLGPQALLGYLSPTCLPLLFLSAEELGPNISFTVSPTCLSFVVCFCLCAVLKVENIICLPLNPTFLPLPSLCCGLLSPVCVPSSNFFDYFLSYMYMVSWQAPIRRLMFPSSVWAQRCITFVTCYLLLADGTDGSEQLLWLHFSLALSPTDLCSSIFYHFLKLVSLRSCTPSTPHLCNMAERMVVISCNATRIVSTLPL